MAKGRMTSTMTFAASAVVTLSALALLLLTPIANYTAAYGTAMEDGNMMQSSGEENMMMDHSAKPQFVRGQISSIQADSDGNPGWLQSGIWVLRPHFGENNDLQSAQLIARFAMVMPDGTAMHEHKMYGFKPTDFTSEQNDTINVMKGTVTVTMRDGPVTDVPVTTKIFNKSVIGFWIGPDKIDEHFGTNSVYGILSTASRGIMEEMGSMVNGEQEDSDAADEAIATARQFILSKLPSLGIEIDNELDLHTDMIVHVSDSEIHIDYSVLDTNEQSHNGHIEVVNGQVTVAILDGNSIL